MAHPSMLRWLAVVALAGALQPLAASADDDYTGAELSADIVTAALPFVAFAVAHDKDDGEGEKQLLRTNAVSLVLNTALRVGFNATSWGERPNGNEYGFPSGHVAFVAAQASFLQERYGWKYGVPAYVLVGYVAWVRVDTDHHRWRDVIAGAALSVAVSRLFVTPHKALRVAPTVGPDWLGLRLERSF